MIRLSRTERPLIFSRWAFRSATRLRVSTLRPRCSSLAWPESLAEEPWIVIAVRRPYDLQRRPSSFSLPRDRLLPSQQRAPPLRMGLRSRPFDPSTRMMMSQCVGLPRRRTSSFLRRVLFRLNQRQRVARLPLLICRLADHRWSNRWGHHIALTWQLCRRVMLAVS